MNFDQHAATPRTWIGKLLYDAGVREISAELSGSGDSGDIDDIAYYNEENEPISSVTIEDNLLNLIKIKKHGRTITPYDELRDFITADACAEGNWYDNDGGSVSSKYIVKPQGIETAYVELTYYEPDEDEFDDDYDDFETDEPGF